MYWMSWLLGLLSLSVTVMVPARSLAVTLAIEAVGTGSSLNMDTTAVSELGGSKACGWF